MVPAMKDFKQNDLVLVNPHSEFQAVGYIVGVSNVGAPVVGKGYIIKVLDNSIPNETYAYDTFSCHECFISKLNDDTHNLEIVNKLKEINSNTINNSELLENKKEKDRLQEIKEKLIKQLTHF